jgi:hypothetical protein
VGRRNVRLPLGAALVAALLAAACTSGAAPAGKAQEDRSEAAAEPAPAKSNAAAAPSPAAAKPARTAAASAAKGVRRCGWLANPTPANWWLTDSKGQWILSTQGGDQAPGMDDMPDMSTAGWTETNGHYGYGCACMTITADAAGRVTGIADAQPRPIKQCRSDKALPKPD